MLVIEVHGSNKADYSACQVKCMDDVPKCLILQGKEYNLVQVVLYGNHHYIGITVVKDKCVLYDGMASYGEEKNRTKTIGGKAKFPAHFYVNYLELT